MKMKVNMFADLDAFFSKIKKRIPALQAGILFMRLPVHKEGGSRQSLSSRQPDYSFKPLFILYHQAYAL